METFVGVFLTWLILSILCGVWASHKGRSGAGFFALSLCLSPLIGFIPVAVAKPGLGKIEEKKILKGEARKCPFCAEFVKREATVCRFCGRDLPKSVEPGTAGILFDPRNSVEPVVKKVIPNSPAAEVGIKVGDRIKERDGTPISNTGDLRSMPQIGVGDWVEYKVLRDTEELTFRVQAVELPEEYK